MWRRFLTKILQYNAFFHVQYFMNSANLHNYSCSTAFWHRLHKIGLWTVCDLCAAGFFFVFVLCSLPGILQPFMTQQKQDFDGPADQTLYLLAVHQCLCFKFGTSTTMLKCCHTLPHGQVLLWFKNGWMCVESRSNYVRTGVKWTWKQFEIFRLFPNFDLFPYFDLAW